MRLTEGTVAKNCLIPLFQDFNGICRVLDHYRPHYVHFCETLTQFDCCQTDLEPFVRFQFDLKEKFPEIGIMRSLPIPQPKVSSPFSTLAMARLLQPVTDVFLTDTWLGREPVEGYIGITGRTADWNTARQLVVESQIPVILAGGLSPGNVFEALMLVRPAGADSCTGTNLQDAAGTPVRFRKDFGKVKRFVEEVRKTERAFGLERKTVEEKLAGLKAELQERQTALPAHSVRPHQLQAIEALEEEISAAEIQLTALYRIESRKCE
jgi:phosphoribosylanthranilate isomerase